MLLATLFITYIIISLFGYVVHWSLHQPWTGRLHVSHMTHHQKLYPPTDFTSDAYRSAGQDSASRIFLLASLPLILIPVMLCIWGILPFYLMVGILVVEALVGFLNDYLHDAFHINHHWLLRTPVLKDIFRIGIRLHYLHHVDMGTNYGIFAFHWDKLFGTFRKR